MTSSDFRVSNMNMTQRALRNLQSNLNRLSDLQEQASSMKRLRKPSDSPIDTVSAMRIRADINRNDQISRNLDDAEAWLATADSALQTTVGQVQRVRDLVIQARNASADPVAREGIASEIDKLRESLIGLANSRYADRAVFSGTASSGRAYTSDGAYVGVSAPVERTISPGVRVQVNVNGDEVFGPAGNDLFTALTAISDAVRNNPAQLDTLAPDLDTRIQGVQVKLAEVGARYARVEAMKSQNSADALTMKKNLSGVEDADLAETMMNLQTEEVAYQAALQATARAIQPSLADFLR
jgi:flagellar hook-associated protein 3 FlgL